MSARAKRPPKLAHPTRTRILEATLRVLARGGPGALTFRSVAKAASAPLGVMTYHFPSRRELVRAAYELHMQRTRAQAQAWAGAYRAAESRRSPVDADAVAGVMTTFVLGASAAERERMLADFELMLETARDPGLERDFSASRAETFRLACTLTAELGSEAPEDDARLIIAVVEGLALEAFAQPRRLSRAVLKRVARRLIQKLLA